MCCVLGALMIGTIAGGTSVDRARIRPALRGLVKSGIVAKRKIQAVSTGVVEEAQKIVNEARMELADERRAEMEQQS